MIETNTNILQTALEIYKKRYPKDTVSLQQLEEVVKEVEALITPKKPKRRRKND